MGNNTKYLKYALNTKGELVHIDSVPNGNDCGCICPACKKPLQAKNKGTHRTHHFAHQSGVNCPTAYESSLHLLAKKKIQEAFYESQAITISFEYKSYCSMNDTCMYMKYGDCAEKTIKSFNLKDYYDKCEQEISYNNINRRSGSSRKSVGITIQLCDSEEEEFFVYDSMQIRPEKFDFGVE